MEKIIKQDGARRVFIYDDESEKPFNQKDNYSEKKSAKSKKLSFGTKIEKEKEKDE